LLRAAGVSLALPWLESKGRAAAAVEPIRRLVCCCTTLGIHAENLIPKEAGREFEQTPYLEPLQEIRHDVTVISGTSHPDVDGGHASEASFLTAAPHPGASSFRNTISLDQYVVEKLPPATRYSHLVLSTGGGSGLSVSRSGVKLPADSRPSELFKKLFVSGTPAEIARQSDRLREGRSILDVVAADARRLETRATAGDRQRLEEYFETVREVERRLYSAEAWIAKPKPRVDVEPPRDVQSAADFVARTRLMFDLIQLALATDSTRIVTLQIQGHNSVPPVEGVSIDWHNLSHHGQDAEKLAQLRLIELAQMKLLAEFLQKLQSVREDASDLLTNTMVLYGSNLGNASSHDTRNLPILLAGGGFRHGQHLAFDTRQNYPLPNLFVSMLQRLGIETNRFASGTSTLRGLEPAT
jgi:hypothetical protein